MKQKNVQIKPKGKLNSVQKDNVKAKKGKKQPEIQVEDEAVELVDIPTKMGKNQKKVPVKAVPPKHVEEEEEEDDSEEEEEEDDSGADVEAGEQASEDDEEDADDDDGNSDEDDQDDENDSDDEPSEVPIEKSSPVAGGIPKINSGNIPPNFPENQVIFVRNLPQKVKQVDLVEVFAKYGTLHTINVTRDDSRTSAFIGFTTPEAATGALAANKTKIKEFSIKVTPQKPMLKKEKMTDSDKEKWAEEKKKAYLEQKKKSEENKDRTVYVKNIKQGTTEDQLRQHFTSCGEIEYVKMVGHKALVYAFVTFKDASSVKSAVELHNSTCNNVTIGVYLHGDESSKAKSKDVKRTVFLKNVQKHKNISGKKLEEIFSQCGEIDQIDILCRKNILAFITFKEEKSAKKALKMSGTTVEELELDVNPYKPTGDKPKNTIFIQNVKPGVTEEEIREVFANTGEIESLYIKAGFAIVKFTEEEAFCKSFLKNETILAGQPIFLEPHSENKQQFLKRVHNKNPIQGKRKSAPFNKAGHNKKFKPNSN